MTINLFEQDGKGVLFKNPLSHQKQFINATKRHHWQEHINSEGGKRQIDRYFEAILWNPDSTDREIQRITGIEISAIPARRADINNDNRGKYREYFIYPSGKRKCRITGKEKTIWRLRRVKNGS